MAYLYLWPLSHDSVAWWHFIKVTEKTPNLEDPYVEFCNSIWPLICIFGKVLLLAKTFWKTQNSENSQKYPKNDIFYAHVSFLKETRMLYMTCLYNTCVYPENANICIETHVYLLHMQLMSLQPMCSCQKYIFWNSSSLVGYAIDSFSCNYFVFDPISSQEYK